MSAPGALAQQTPGVGGCLAHRFVAEGTENCAIDSGSTVSGATLPSFCDSSSSGIAASWEADESTRSFGSEASELAIKMQAARRASRRRGGDRTSGAYMSALAMERFADEEDLEAVEGPRGIRLHHPHDEWLGSSVEDLPLWRWWAQERAKAASCKISL